MNEKEEIIEYYYYSFDEFSFHTWYFNISVDYPEAVECMQMKMNTSQHWVNIYATYMYIYRKPDIHIPKEIKVQSPVRIANALKHFVNRKVFPFEQCSNVDTGYKMKLKSKTDNKPGPMNSL